VRRRDFIKAVAGSVAAWPLVARAQQPGKVYSIGLFSAGASPALPAFVEGLRRLGWVEGKNVVFVFRSGENHLDRLSPLAVELVQLNVDVIVTSGTLAPLAAKQATSTIPIVMAPAGDPVGSGLVDSLARPGGNLTGLSLMAPDLGGKRLELLKELRPGIFRVAILWNATNPYAALVMRETATAAATLGLERQSFEVTRPSDLEGVLESARRYQPDALIVVEDPFTVSLQKQIIDFAGTNRLPAIYGLREFVQTGGLMAYGASLSDLRQRAASYVDKILKGAKPADLPIQQPTKFELIINLKTARALGLEVPVTLLSRADEVIE
jgi:putative tryptophan/tyrosine transport system substrate-binding protein